MKYYIYALIDPRNSIVFYFGKTTNVRLRFNSHMHNARKGYGQPVHLKMAEMLSLDILPRLQVVDEIDTPHDILALKLEHWWVIKEKNSGNLALENCRHDGVCRSHAGFDTYPARLKKLAFATVDELEEFEMLELHEEHNYYLEVERDLFGDMVRKAQEEDVNER